MIYIRTRDVRMPTISAPQKTSYLGTSSLVSSRHCSPIVGRICYTITLSSCRRTGVILRQGPSEPDRRACPFPVPNCRTMAVCTCDLACLKPQMAEVQLRLSAGDQSTAAPWAQSVPHRISVRRVISSHSLHAHRLKRSHSYGRRVEIPKLKAG